MTSDNTIVLVGLLLITTPCLPLLWKLRPRHGWIYMLRGEEVASVAATALLSVIGIYDLIYVVSFEATSYATILANLLGMVLCSLLLWARLLQKLRHDARNRETITSALEQLEQGYKTHPQSHPHDQKEQL